MYMTCRLDAPATYHLLNCLTHYEKQTISADSITAMHWSVHQCTAP